MKKNTKVSSIELDDEEFLIYTNIYYSLWIKGILLKTYKYNEFNLNS